MPAPIPMMNAGVPPSMPMMPASMSSSARSSSSTESLQNQKPILNPHGGGRGYIPGKTPDDPKKRHKCDVCGRGFARAFNLKVCSSFTTDSSLRYSSASASHVL
jgi:hypothetical protein